MSDRDSVPMVTRTLQRTYLVRRVETVVVEVPADYDIDEWRENDLWGLADYIDCEGTCLHEDYEGIDFDVQDLEITEVPA